MNKIETIKNTWNGYVISVNYQHEEDDNDVILLKDIDLFEKSIISYLELFNKLPLKGLEISNSHCDVALIKDIIFYGVDKEIRFWLEFE